MFELNYLESAKKQFAYYKLQGEKTFEQLSDEDLFWQYNEESNSIAIIVNHLWGNMKSRWTNFMTTDGEKEWRERDQEFEQVIKTRKEMMEKWEDGWSCLYEALESIDESNFNAELLIRNRVHSVADAINRQMMHYASHIGQIVYIGRMIKGAQWESLSIPKGKSDEFNRIRFAQGEKGGHFTDDLK